VKEESIDFLPWSLLLQHCWGFHHQISLLCYPKKGYNIHAPSFGLHSIGFHPILEQTTLLLSISSHAESPPPVCLFQLLAQDLQSPSLLCKSQFYQCWLVQILEMSYGCCKHCPRIIPFYLANLQNDKHRTWFLWLLLLSLHSWLIVCDCDYHSPSQYGQNNCIFHILVFLCACTIQSDASGRLDTVVLHLLDCSPQQCYFSLNCCSYSGLCLESNLIPSCLVIAIF
jgi:hypothetical protein